MIPGAQAGAAQFAGPLGAADVARARGPRALERLGQAIGEARDALIGLQKPDGHWLFELEADCTIPAEYILMMHYLDEIEPQLERKLAVYLREHQAAHGGWPLYHFESDTKAGDLTGQGNTGFGAVWWVVAPNGEPLPSS